MGIHYIMVFDWNPEKNEELKAKRGISFEEIALLLGNGEAWRVAEHWNKSKYPRQSVFFLPIDGYIYLIPYVEDDDTIFLKTAIPSRKATKAFLKELEVQNEEE